MFFLNFVAMKPIVQRFRGFVSEASAGCGRMFRILGVAALPMAVVASGCSARGDAAPGVGEPLGVAVTVPPLEYFARAIGGDSVAVTTLLKSGSDPETFEPGVGAMKALGGSDLLLSTGLMPFEQSLAQKSSSRGEAPRIVSVSDGIDLIHGTHGHEHAGEHRHSDASDEREELYADPHIWSSVGNARIIAENVLRAFCHADTARTPYYTANYRTLIVRLDSLEGAWKGRLAPVGGSSFAIRHPALSYFARDFGLRQLALTDGQKESSAGGRAQVLDGIRRAQPVVFFVEQGADPARAEMVGRTVGLNPVEINPMSADWEGEMSRTVDALAGAASR